MELEWTLCWQGLDTPRERKGYRGEVRTEHQDRPVRWDFYAPLGSDAGVCSITRPRNEVEDFLILSLVAHLQGMSFP